MTGHRFLRVALGLAAAGAPAFAQPAEAAMGCWNADQAAAAKVRDLQSRLMVATLRCRAIGIDLLPAYNDFVRANRDTLQQANGLLRAQFALGYGPEGESAYDHFATALANAYGGDSTTQATCDDTAAAASEAAGAAGDVTGLLAVESRLGPPPELPGGVCPIAFSQG